MQVLGILLVSTRWRSSSAPTIFINKLLIQDAGLGDLVGLDLMAFELSPNDIINKLLIHDAGLGDLVGLD